MLPQMENHQTQQPLDGAVQMMRPKPEQMIDTCAITAACRGGSPSSLEKIEYVQDCLSYLMAAQENKTRSTATQGNTLIFHTYWSGKPSWRIELLVKSYLFTQNLQLSQLWLWLDEDTDPLAMEQWNSSKTGKQLQPLVDTGLLVLKSWQIPQRVRLPAHIDHTDGIGYLEKKGYFPFPDAYIIGDGIIRDPTGEVYVVLPSSYTQAVLTPVVRSDIFRFVALHNHGGIYLDMDVLLLRDMRPLWSPETGFAERWSALMGKGDLNTAVLSLSAMSELSSYFLRMGRRLGLNFHPRVLGNIATKDGYLDDPASFTVFETAVFDPAWLEQQGTRKGPRTVPCFNAFKDFFDEDPMIKAIWEQQKAEMSTEQVSVTSSSTISILVNMKGDDDGSQQERLKRPQADSLRAAIGSFYRGAYAYHIHNNWAVQPKVASWASAFRHTYDMFFEGSSPNLYGEYWTGPSLAGFEEFN